MKKPIILSLIYFILCSFTYIQSTYVYVCKGPQSKVYHKSDHCKGLSHCSTQVFKITLEESKQMGRRPCRMEFK